MSLQKVASIVSKYHKLDPHYQKLIREELRIKPCDPVSDEEIIKFIAKNPKCTARQIAKGVGLSSAGYRMRSLRKCGHIKATSRGYGMTSTLEYSVR